MDPRAYEPLDINSKFKSKCSRSYISLSAHCGSTRHEFDVRDSSGIGLCYLLAYSLLPAHLLSCSSLTHSAAFYCSLFCPPLISLFWSLTCSAHGKHIPSKCCVDFVDIHLEAKCGSFKTLQLSFARHDRKKSHIL